MKVADDAALSGSAGEPDGGLSVLAGLALRPLQQTGLTSLFAVYPTLEDALETS